MWQDTRAMNTSPTLTTRQQARFAGILYAVMIALAVPGLILIPVRVIVPGDAFATAEHLRAHATLTRIGIAGELCSQVLFLFLGLALYDLLEPVNRRAARAMVMLVLVSVP